MKIERGHAVVSAHKNTQTTVVSSCSALQIGLGMSKLPHKGLRNALQALLSRQQRMPDQQSSILAQLASDCLVLPLPQLIPREEC